MPSNLFKFQTSKKNKHISYSLTTTQLLPIYITFSTYPSMYHIYFTHKKWDFSQPVTLTQSAEVPGNAGHRSAPHESPQDWLGPRSEVVARVNVESQGVWFALLCGQHWSRRVPKKRGVSTNWVTDIEMVRQPN